MLTNLVIILNTTKLFMEKIDALGISSYYDSLVRGDKDTFTIEVANAIGKSTATVRRKIRLGSWNQKTEIDKVTDIINSRTS